MSLSLPGCRFLSIFYSCGIEGERATLLLYLQLTKPWRARVSIGCSMETPMSPHFIRRGSPASHPYVLSAQDLGRILKANRVQGRALSRSSLLAPSPPALSLSLDPEPSPPLGISDLNDVRIVDRSFCLSFRFIIYLDFGERVTLACLDTSRNPWQTLATT